jgi:hypothetical protein
VELEGEALRVRENKAVAYGEVEGEEMEMEL